MNDVEYDKLVTAMDDLVKGTLRDQIEEAIAKKVKEGEENYREYRKVIEEKH